MNTNPTCAIVTERVDDIPLLLTHMMQMGLPNLLDAHFPTHTNWEGLSLGWTATIWLTHILSQADHRLFKSGSRLGCQTYSNPFWHYGFESSSIGL